MSTAARSFRAAIVAAALALCLGISPANAQPPACGGNNITVKSNITSTVYFCLITSAGKKCTGTVTAGGTVNIPVPAGTVVGGIESYANAPASYGWGGAPAWWLHDIQCDAGPGTGSPACFDITFNPATCTVTITAVGGAVMGSTGPPCSLP
jgi:hypothetical protein